MLYGLVSKKDLSQAGGKVLIACGKLKGKRKVFEDNPQIPEFLLKFQKERAAMKK